MRPEEATISTSPRGTLTSPHILDPDIDSQVIDTDFDFFNRDSTQVSPGTNDLFEDSVFATPASQDQAKRNYHLDARLGDREPGSLQSDQGSHIGTARPHSASNTSSASPPSSSQGSSSGFSRGVKRKTSSNSSHSALQGGDITMTEDADMADWKGEDLLLGGDEPSYSSFDSTLLAEASNPLGMDPDFELSNKAMETHFDFDSAASSPSPVGAGATSGDISGNQARIFDIPYRQSPTPQKKPPRHYKASSHHITQPSVNGLSAPASREASPLSAMVTSQESSPTAFFDEHTPSPVAAPDYESRSILGASAEKPVWPATYGATETQEFSPHPRSGFTPSPFLNGFAMPSSPAVTQQSLGQMSALTVHPTPLKSRVETQIPIKLTLFPIPAGVSKLHLPTHTISKPKLLAKKPLEKTSDMLELHTTLVCTSAMQSPERLQRALARAAGQMPMKREDAGSSGTDDSPTEEEEENKPLNGGEVKICMGCITRERKRAARKKVKKVEEEASWHEDEDKRVIVFNTNEIKEWQHPSKEGMGELPLDQSPPPVPEGAMQVDAPMRIACYCRHQNEKLGFQVIFTIKDHRDQLVAQAITSSIMITDDHKTHAPPPTLQAPQASDTSQLPGAGVFASAPGYSIPTMPPASDGMGPFRVSHSSSDLQSLQQSYASPFTPTSASFGPNMSQTTSASMTPRNLSRQASPSAQLGQPSKKRKASGSGKVPSGLAMTRLETSQPSSTQTIPSAGMVNSATPSASSSYNPNFGQYGRQAENSYISPPMTAPPPFSAGPPTPNSNDQGLLNRSHSMENLPMQPMFSAPTSAPHSRAPSPTAASRNNATALQQAQMAQAVANGIYGLPLALNPHRPPTIHKLIPNEGPKTGGIEVTCLGSGFCQGLEVMFGGSLATTTTYWGDTSLVCLLPPAVQAGTVAVTFKHQHQQQQMQPYPNPSVSKHQPLFKYIDDDEQQLLRMALSVLGNKMTGRMEDVRDIARRIVGNGPNSWGPSTANSPTSGTQHGGTQHGSTMASHANMLGLLDMESTLLKFLDLIDLDDSAHQPRFNIRRSSGHTMLHIASSLGMHRFVAGLLARGANPEPRDKGGYTPMHFAALHGHAQIVRRLILNGADPTMRNLQGYTPGDMASSKEVRRATEKIEQLSRTRSGPASTLNRRVNSANSLKSLWEPPMMGRSMTDFASDTRRFYTTESAGSETSADDDADDLDGVAMWPHSRRGSGLRLTERGSRTPPSMQGSTDAARFETLRAPSMLDWRNQIAAQLQNIQQSVQWNLPNLPQMPALPDYQLYLPNPMVRRISSLVPYRAPPRPSTAPGEATDAKDGENRWWDLFSSPAPPPAYEDIYPNSEDRDLDVKKSSATRAAADIAADQACADAFDTNDLAAPSASTEIPHIRIGQTLLSPEQQRRLREARARKVQKIGTDKNLFMIWLPLLVVIFLAMVVHHWPTIAIGVSRGLSYLEKGRVSGAAMTGAA
ncbi:MAG: hypothetical protein M1833_002105 [Piccolia ochrophora]|nr:MAG: hypothetical protein M1833_002105 [Piccolia ochrophora]